MSSWRDERFSTSAECEDGVRVDLVDRAGEPTGDWLMVRGRDSKVWRRADDRAARRIREASAPREGESAAVREQRITETVEAAYLDLSSAAVLSWSFQEECTPEAVRAFLEHAPYVRRQVDAVAEDLQLFFALRSPRSSGSLSTTPPSTSPTQGSRAPDVPSAST